jgi:DNA-binding LacI/PurR family transcriptional regulator
MTRMRVTSLDVAKRAGVSRTTVSIVLNDIQGFSIPDDTRQRVMQAALDLNYVPNAAAQALASRRSQIVGLILTRSPHHILSDVFLNQVLDGLIQTVHKHEMLLMIEIVEPQHQEQAYLQLIRAKRIDGLLLSGPRFDDQALLALEKDSFPTVLMGRLPGTGFPSIDVDNLSAACNAVDHLIGLGHRNIACITNAGISYTAASDRLNGYRQAIESAGITYNDALVRFGDFDPESGYKQMNSLLAAGSSISAVFVASDVVALGAKAAIRERGLRIPQDIAVVGFDDVPLARYLDPPLTTVRIPATELAIKAGEAVVQLINGNPPPHSTELLQTQLIVRESCGASMMHS